MRGNRVGQRVRRHLDAQNEALNCVSAGRLIVLPDLSALSSTTYEVQISSTDSDEFKLLRLRGDESLHLDVRQRLRQDTILADDSSSLLVAYMYRLLLRSDDGYPEVVAFHWTPDAESPQRTHPHMHVGSVVTAGSSFRPKDFNRLHIPTGPVSLEAVLLFAVEELGVEPAHGREREAVIEQLREGDRGGH